VPTLGKTSAAGNRYLIGRMGSLRVLVLVLGGRKLLATLAAGPSRVIGAQRARRGGSPPGRAVTVTKAAYWADSIRTLSGCWLCAGGRGLSEEVALSRPPIAGSNQLSPHRQTPLGRIREWFESKIANGLIEGLNSVVQAAKAKARGYRSTRNLKAIIYLLVGKLDMQLSAL
jgi:Transposase